MITRTQQEVSDIIEHFIDGTVGNWDWDDFCSHRTADPDLDLIRVKCSGLGSTHRPTVKGHFCNEMVFGSCSCVRRYKASVGPEKNPRTQTPVTLIAVAYK